MYYKIMNEDYYHKHRIIDTRDINYSLAVPNPSDRQNNYFNYVIETSRRNNLPVEFFIVLACNLNMVPDVELYYFDNLLNNDNLDKIPLNRILPKSDKYKEISIAKDLFYEVIIEARTNQIVFEDTRDAQVFWEYLYETIREKKFPNCPSRRKSYFAFTDISSIKYQMNEHDFSEVACEISASGCDIAFEADMSLIDSIQNHFTYSQIDEIVSRYWNQERTDDKISEVLLQGKVELGEKVTI